MKVVRRSQLAYREQVERAHEAALEAHAGQVAEVEAATRAAEAARAQLEEVLAERRAQVEEQVKSLPKGELRAQARRQLEALEPPPKVAPPVLLEPPPKPDVVVEEWRAERVREPTVVQTEWGEATAEPGTYVLEEVLSERKIIVTASDYERDWQEA